MEKHSFNEDTYFIREKEEEGEDYKIAYQP